MFLCLLGSKIPCGFQENAFGPLPAGPLTWAAQVAFTLLLRTFQAPFPSPLPRPFLSGMYAYNISVCHCLGLDSHFNSFSFIYIFQFHWISLQKRGKKGKTHAHYADLSSVLPPYSSPKVRLN